MLLGFGIKVDRITRLFDVRTLDSAERGQVRIEFTSKDLDRTFNFSRIVVSFDERQLEPRVIEMEDNMGTRTITLRRVRINPTIRDSVFEIPRFSADELDINGAEHL
jgi:outer membrane lipoprotein-sorting protein